MYTLNKSGTGTVQYGEFTAITVYALQYLSFVIMVKYLNDAEQIALNKY